MDVITWPAGKPGFDFGGFVGRVVVHDDMGIGPFGNLSVDLFEKVQELSGPMTLVALPMTKPEATSSAANKEVVPCRT